MKNCLTRLNFNKHKVVYIINQNWTGFFRGHHFTGWFEQLCGIKRGREAGW